MPFAGPPPTLFLMPNKPILFFDGYCGLCNGAVRFLLKTDQNQELLFSSLQGQEILKYPNPPSAPFETIYLYLPTGDRLTRSDAAIYLIKMLPKLSWLSWISWLPRPLRDGAYALVAKYRHKVFKTPDTCDLVMNHPDPRILP